jgi:hypothetical protein
MHCGIQHSAFSHRAAKGLLAARQEHYGRLALPLDGRWALKHQGFDQRNSKPFQQFQHFLYNQGNRIKLQLDCNQLFLTPYIARQGGVYSFCLYGVYGLCLFSSSSVVLVVLCNLTV